MANNFPALPNTSLLILDPDSLDDPTCRSVPILGWTNPQGTSVMPLTATPAVPIIHGTAYKVPIDDSGENFLVTDPTHRQTFEGEDAVEDWLEFIVSVTPEDAPTLASLSGINVFFSDKKSYSKSSWWHFQDGPDNEFVFALQGGDLNPEDPRVKRITREVFAKLKKTVDVRTLNEILNPPEPEEAVAALDEEAEDLV